jgi:Pyridoxal-phosphate dependent enzyme
LAFAGARAGVAVTIVVPEGNSTEKNAAMRSLGAELIELGRDFDEARKHAAQIAAERGLKYAPSFHRDFVVGVRNLRARAVYLGLRSRHVYVPVGLGSGICGVIGTRDALGLKARIVGVVPRPRIPIAAPSQRAASGRPILRSLSPTGWRFARLTRWPWRSFSAARITLSRCRMLTGQNIDRRWMQTVLAGNTPQAC